MSLGARRIGPGERAYVVVTLFLLSYSLPTVWLTGGGDAEYESGGALDLVVFTGLLGGSVLLAALHGPQLARALRAEAWLPVLLGYLVVSSLWSYDPGVSMRRSIGLVLTTVFAYYLVSRFPLADIVALLGVALAIGVALNFAFIAGLPRLGNSEAGWTGIVSHKNGLGRMAVLGVLTHLQLIKLRPRFRMWHGVLAAANVALVAGSRSTTAAVATMSLVALLVIYRTFRARRTLFGAVLVGLTTAGVVGTLAAMDRFAALTEMLGKDVTLTGRTTLWADSLRAVAERPLFGHGYDGFWGGWWSPNHELWLRNPWEPPHSHNAMLEMLLAGGIVGLVLLVVITGRALGRAVRYLRDVPGYTGMWPLAYLSYVILISLTERGIVNRSVFWTLFTVTVVAVGMHRLVGVVPPGRPPHRSVVSAGGADQASLASTRS